MDQTVKLRLTDTATSCLKATMAAERVITSALNSFLCYNILRHLEFTTTVDPFSDFSWSSVLDRWHRQNDTFFTSLIITHRRNEGH